MTTETEQQRTTEMLDESQVRVHVNKDRAGIFRLILSLRPESWPENISAIEWLSTSIVHDLRNPVAAIYAAAEMLMDPDPAPTQVKRLAANIFRAAGRMRELLADLNSVARGNRPTAEMCDIGEVIAAASEAASAATENHSVQMVLEVPEGIELPLTRPRMERVFFNLIANALEAMPTGGKFRIVARKAGNCANWKIRGLEFRAEFGTGYSNRSSQQASRTASLLGWPSPGKLFSPTVAQFGLSPTPALALLSAFPSIGLVFNRNSHRLYVLAESSIPND